MFEVDGASDIAVVIHSLWLKEAKKSTIVVQFECDVVMIVKKKYRRKRLSYGQQASSEGLQQLFGDDLDQRECGRYSTQYETVHETLHLGSRL